MLWHCFERASEYIWGKFLLWHLHGTLGQFCYSIEICYFIRASEANPSSFSSPEVLNLPLNILSAPC